jgi:hypothetical protein
MEEGLGFGSGRSIGWAESRAGRGDWPEEGDDMWGPHVSERE